MHDAHHLTHLTVLLLAAISGIRTLSTASVENETEELQSVVGDTVTFTCPLRKLQTRATWIKLPNRTLAIGNRIQENDDRLDVRGSDRSTSRLRLVNANRSDTGVYECRQTVTKVTKRISLVVRYAPAIAKNPDTITIENGGDVQLFCEADGRPVPNVTWRRVRTSEEDSAAPKMDDIVFLGSHLNITNVQADDRGTYSCEASNGIAPNAKWDLLLQVEFAPEVVILKPEVSQAINYTAELMCQIEGFPTPEVTWTKNDNQLLTNETRPVMVTNVLREGPMKGAVWTASSVTLDSVRSSDFGNYSCRAENSFGQTSATLTLSESSFPVLPQVKEGDDGKIYDGGVGGIKKGFYSSTFNVTGFILGMMPPLWISFYIILHLGFRSRYAEERPEEEGGDGLDEIVWEQGFHSKY